MIAPHVGATFRAGDPSLVSSRIDVNSEQTLRHRRRASWVFVVLLLAAPLTGAVAFGHPSTTVGDRAGVTVEDEVALEVMDRDRSQRSVARRAARGVPWRPRCLLLSRRAARRMRLAAGVDPVLFRGHFSPPRRGPPSAG